MFHPVRGTHNQDQQLINIEGNLYRTVDGQRIFTVDIFTPSSIWQIRFKTSLTPIGLRNCVLTAVAFAAIGILQYTKDS